MDKWEKAQMYAAVFLLYLVMGVLLIAVSLFVLACPVIGVDMILKGFPIIGVPLTVVFSLAAIAYLVLIVSWIVAKVKEAR